MKKYRIYIGVVAIALIAVVCGCVPKEQQFKPAIQAPALHDDAIIASDGAKLRLQTWKSNTWKSKTIKHEGGKPQAIIIAVHGFNDYSNAFQTFGEYAMQHEIDVYAYDQRGYGVSDQWGIWAGEQNLLRDLSDATKAIALKNPNIPIYVAGESMGGAVLMLAAEQKMLQSATGLILFAPAVWGGENMHWWYRAPLWLGAHLIPAKRWSGRGMGYVPSDNVAMLEELGRDPLIIKQSRTDTIYGVSNLMDNAYHATVGIKQPLLMLYGAHDEIIPVAPIYDVMQKLQGESQMMAYYQNGFHMLTRDLQQEVVHKDVIAWVMSLNKKRLPSGANQNVLRRIKADMQKF